MIYEYLRSTVEHLYKKKGMSELCLEMISKIDSRRYTRVYGTVKEDKIITVVVTPIQQYILLLERVYSTLKDRRAIKASDIPVVLIDVSLKRWMLDTEGMYLDTKFEIERLLSISSDFIKEMISIKNEDDFISSRNYRLTEFLLENLIGLINDLYEIRYT
jgi:hypothetical protein